MALVSLATLRSRAADLADMPTPSSSTFVPTATWTQWINDGLQELYDILTGKFEDYYTTSTVGTTANGTETYSVPATFYKLVGIDLQLSNGKWKTLQPFTPRERNAYRNQMLAVPPEYETRYWLTGSLIHLLPVPTTALTYTLWYIPQMTLLVNDTDTFDGINGFEMYAVVTAAIRAMVKEEADPSALMQMKAEQLERIQKASSNRDSGNPPTVSDVYRDDLGWL